jgi:hypothetical protein
MSQGLCRLPSRASLPSAESRFICGARARMAACTAEAAASEESLRAAPRRRRAARRPRLGGRKKATLWQKAAASSPFVPWGTPRTVNERSDARSGLLARIT